MTNITASMVKELRQRTNVGMMDCKKALVETQGDLEAAIDLLRKKGMAKAAKKSSRIAAEGIIAIELDGLRGAISEVNCETDFVARDDSFVTFAKGITHVTLTQGEMAVDALGASPLGDGGETVEKNREGLVSQLGENIQIRRVRVLTADTVLGSYLHGNRIGVLVALKGGDEALAKDIAMHIAAAKPSAIRGDDVDQSVIDREREIFTAHAKESGKPADIVEKMVAGRLDKFLNEVSLLGQSFVKDPSVKIATLLEERKAQVSDFVRFEVGEGIEKEASDFVAEVMAQARGE